MKLRICIALFCFALFGGVASALVGASHAAQADDCGGYVCSATGAR